MSNRSKAMLAKAYEGLQRPCPELPVVNPAPSPGRHGRRVLDDDQLSLFTESEAGVMNPDFVEPNAMTPTKKCETWTQKNQNYFEAGSSPATSSPMRSSNSKMLAPTQTTPMRNQPVAKRPLVAYSSSPTCRSDSTRSTRFVNSPSKGTTSTPLKCSSVLQLVANSRQQQSNSSNIESEPSGKENVPIPSQRTKKPSQKHDNSVPGMVTAEQKERKLKDSSRLSLASDHRVTVQSSGKKHVDSPAASGQNDLSCGEEFNDTSSVLTSHHQTDPSDCSKLSENQEVLEETDPGSREKLRGTLTPSCQSGCIVENETKKYQKKEQCTESKKKPALKLGVRHPNFSSKTVKTSDLLNCSPVGSAVSVTQGAENLSPYQKLKLRNMAENEAILTELMQDKPSVSEVKSKDNGSGLVKKKKLVMVQSRVKLLGVCLTKKKHLKVLQKEAKPLTIHQNLQEVACPLHAPVRIKLRVVLSITCRMNQIQKNQNYLKNPTQT